MCRVQQRNGMYLRGRKRQAGWRMSFASLCLPSRRFLPFPSSIIHFFFLLCCCVLFGAFTCAAQHFDGFFIKTNSSPPGGTRTSFLSQNQMERGRNLFIKKINKICIQPTLDCFNVWNFKNLKINESAVARYANEQCTCSTIYFLKKFRKITKTSNLIILIFFKNFKLKKKFGWQQIKVKKLIGCQGPFSPWKAISPAKRPHKRPAVGDPVPTFGPTTASTFLDHFFHFDSFKN